MLLCGSTGDWPSLSVDERVALMTAWAAALQALRAARVPNVPQLMVHVGSTDIAQAQALAAAAEAVGADAILIVSPGVVYRPATTLQSVQDLASIAAAAPHTPSFYYHFPGLYGVDLSMLALVQTAFTGGAGNTTLWPTLAGVKYIDSNFQDLAAAAQWATAAGRPQAWYVGTGILLQQFAFAGVGAGPQGSPIYSVQMKATRPIWEGIAAGNWTQAAVGQMNYFAFTNLATCPCANRAIYRAIYGVDIGPSRRPNIDCTPAQTTAMVAALQAAGLL